MLSRSLCWGPGSGGDPIGFKNEEPHLHPQETPVSSQRSGRVWGESQGLSVAVGGAPTEAGAPAGPSPPNPITHDQSQAASEAGSAVNPPGTDRVGPTRHIGTAHRDPQWTAPRRVPWPLLGPDSLSTFAFDSCSHACTHEPPRLSHLCQVCREPVSDHPPPPRRPSARKPRRHGPNIKRGLCFRGTACWHGRNSSPCFLKQGQVKNVLVCLFSFPLDFSRNRFLRLQSIVNKQRSPRDTPGAH